MFNIDPHADLPEGSWRRWVLYADLSIFFGFKPGDRCDFWVNYCTANAHAGISSGAIFLTHDLEWPTLYESIGSPPPDNAGQIIDAMRLGLSLLDADPPVLRIIKTTPEWFLFRRGRSVYTYLPRLDPLELETLGKTPKWMI